jgi:hypothetical protein
MLRARVTKEEYDALSDELKKEHGDPDKDGNRLLAVTAVDGIELAPVKNLKTALEKERQSNSEAQKKLKLFADLDPEAAREALAKVEELKDWDPEKKLAEAKKQFEQTVTAKFEQDRTALTTKFQKESEGMSKKVNLLTTQLQSALIDSAATSAITAAKGSVELLLPLIRSKTQLKLGDDGKASVVILSDDGVTPRLSPKGGSTDPMSLSELITELRDSSAYARAFDGTGASGSGAGGGDNNKGKPFVLAQADALNPVKYRLAKEAAIKAGQELVIQ